MTTAAADHKENYYYWECPVCGDVCSDPNDFRTTVCHNGHVVILGHVRDNGTTMDAWRQAQ